MPRPKATPRRPGFTERQVTEQVLDYCKALGIALERRNVGAARYPNADGSERVVRFGEADDPDWEATVPRGPNRGKRLCVELKATGKRPRPGQLDRLRRLNEDGAIAVWFDGLEAAMRALPRILEGWRTEFDAKGYPWVTDESLERRDA